MNKEIHTQVYTPTVEIEDCVDIKDALEPVLKMKIRYIFYIKIKQNIFYCIKYKFDFIMVLDSEVGT